MHMKAIRFCFVLFLLYICFCTYLSAQGKQFKVLLITTTRGWHHESIHAGVLALQDLGRR